MSEQSAVRARLDGSGDPLITIDKLINSQKIPSTYRIDKVIQ